MQCRCTTFKSIGLFTLVTCLGGLAEARAQGFEIGKKPTPCQALAVAAAVPPDAPLQLELFSESVGPDGFPTLSHFSVPVPVELNLCNDLGHAERIWVEGPGWWSPRAAFAISKNAPRIDLKVYPTGDLRGRLAAGARSLQVAAMRFENAASSRADHPVPPSETSCTVSAASFNCVLPAQTLDLVLEVEGFAPRRFQGVEIARGAVRDLGEVQLEPLAGMSQPPADDRGAR